tara:strand:+ start:282 stop:959 length:678 start_codon:yes stop_codon:yes gene_type:complete
MQNFVKNNRIVHNIVSFLINLIPNFIAHNLGKYDQIKKAIFNTAIDSIEGDYIEFGIFTGACINHANLTWNKIKKNYDVKRKFYGLDSFEGFPDDNEHKHFESNNFKSSFEFSKKLEKKFLNQCFIIPGFFNNTIPSLKDNYKLNKIAIAFIDCDLYSSSLPCIDFIKKNISNGGYIIVDDCHNLDLKGKTILHAIKETFNINNNLFLIDTYGYSGMVYRYIETN